jgi:uncharacterized protein YidB (DUF937 family)
MGLLDILNTIQNTLPPGGMPGGMPTGPRSSPIPMPSGGAPDSQGMSPIAKALLALLAVYAAKNLQRAPAPGPSSPAGAPGGGLGDLLKGPLGGILGGTLGGAAAGTVLNGGLGDLLKQLQDAGQGDAARSWVGTGPNKAISQGDLASALGGDTLDQLTGETGMPRAQLLSGLSQHLPDFVDRLTPNGRLPTNDEAARMV